MEIKMNIDKKIKLKEYVELSNLLNDISDIKLEEVSLLDVYEITDCDFDKTNGRGIGVKLNGGIKIVWFETNDKIITSVSRIKVKKYDKIIKNRIIECLSDKLFMYHQMMCKVNWDNKEFSKSNKKIKEICNNIWKSGKK
jgi:hypothetical protein